MPPNTEQHLKKLTLPACTATVNHLVEMAVTMREAIREKSGGDPKLHAKFKELSLNTLEAHVDRHHGNKASRYPTLDRMNSIFTSSIGFPEVQKFCT